MLININNKIYFKYTESDFSYPNFIRENKVKENRFLNQSTFRKI